MNILKMILGGLGTLASGTGQALSPNQVGSRRAKVSLTTFYVGVAFVIAAHFLGISDSIVMGILALGGVPATAFVVGESYADSKGRNGTNQNH